MGAASSSSSVLVVLFLLFLSLYQVCLAQQQPLVDVYLVAHSHCDAGWLKTVDEYYTSEVRGILTQVFHHVSADQNKKFSWSEIVFFKRWWLEQSPATQLQFKKLVEDKRIEFIGAGWVQNDEAIAYYNSVIDQLTEGHQFILDTFGITPKIAWQIDPFGPSTVTPILFQEAGYRYLVLNRVDERAKTVFRAPPVDIPGSGNLIREKRFEFWWQASKSLPESRLFSHILNTFYTSPQVCWPNVTNPIQSICTGFDFEADSGINPAITPENIAARADLFVNICKSRSQSYVHNKLMVPMGHDFAYRNASLQFTNIDYLISYINANYARYGITLKYATPSEYFEAVFKSTPSPQFPLVGASDFYPYTLCQMPDYANYNTCASYWSGYYTSYPELKRYSRERDALLRVGELLYSFSGADDFQQKQSLISPSSSKQLHQSTPSSPHAAVASLSSSRFHLLRELREASAVMTHHDAITGTSKVYVLDDYHDMLSNGTRAVNELIEQIMAGMLGRNGQLADVTVDGELMKHLPPGTITPVTFFNPLAWPRTEMAKMNISDKQDLMVYDALGSVVPSQIMAEAAGTERHLFFPVTLPPLAYGTYFVASIGGEETMLEGRASVVHADKLRADSFTMDNPYYRVDFQQMPSGIMQIAGIQNKFEGRYYPVRQELLEYPGAMDTMYRFRPNATASLYAPLSPEVYVAFGPLVQELTVVYSSSVRVVTRLYNLTAPTALDQLAYVEVDYHAAVAPQREMIARYSVPDLPTGGLSYTDNGIEMMQRRPQIHYNDTYLWSVIAGKYFPITHTAFIREIQRAARGDDHHVKEEEENDEEMYDGQEHIQAEDPSTLRQVTVLTRQPMGGSSQYDGSIEVMLQRRASGFHWSINGTLNDTSTAHVTLRLMFATQKFTEHVRPQMALLFNNPMFNIYTRPRNFTVAQWVSLLNHTRGFASSSFPPNLHFLSLKRLSDTSRYAILRVQHLFEVDQDPIYSLPTSVNMSRILQGFGFKNSYETSLTGTPLVNGTLFPGDLILTLHPLHINTYIVDLTSKGLEKADDNNRNKYDDATMIGIAIACGVMFVCLVILVVLVYRDRLTASRNPLRDRGDAMKMMMDQESEDSDMYDSLTSTPTEG